MSSTLRHSAYRFMHGLTTSLTAPLVFVFALTRAEAADMMPSDRESPGEEAVERYTTLFPIVKDRKLGFIDQRGRVVLEPVFALSHVGGTQIWPPANARVLADNPTAEEYDLPGAYPVRFPRFHCGVVMVVKDDRVGYVRRDGKILAPPIFRAGADFQDGLTWAQSQDTTYCLLDTEGRILMRDVEECALFEEGLAPIKIGGKYGYIDRKGKMVITPRYDSASAFSEGIACAEESGQQWLIDRQGRQIAPIDGRLERFSEGMAVIYHPTTRKYGYVDTRGNQVIVPQFEAANPFHEGLAVVCLRGKYGFINREGRFAIEPRFEHADHFVRGRATVRVLDPERPGRFREGIVDRCGEYVVKPEYEWIGASRDGFTIVKTTDQRLGLIDMRGVLILEPQYRALHFADHCRLVAQSGKFVSLLDYTNKEILPAEYFEIAATLGDGMRYVGKSVQGQGKFGYADVWGRMVISPRFDYAENFECGLARVAVDIDYYIPAAFSVFGGTWGYIDKNGNWVWRPTR